MHWHCHAIVCKSLLVAFSTPNASFSFEMEQCSTNRACHKQKQRQNQTSTLTFFLSLTLNTHFQFHHLILLTSPSIQPTEEKQKQCLSSTFSSASTPFARNMTNTTLISSDSSTLMAMTSSLASTLPLNPAFKPLSMFLSLFPFYFLVVYLLHPPHPHCFLAVISNQTTQMLDL